MTPMTQEDEIKMMENILFFDDGFVGSFKEYLQEAISIKKTSYGTNKDLNDKKIDDHGDEAFATGFESTKNGKTSRYVVIVRKGELMFSEIIKGDIKNPGLANKLTMNRNAFVVFGNVVYIAIQMMKKLNLSYVYFDGLTPKHQKVYKRALQNKNIQKAAKAAGITFDTNTHGNKYYLRQNKG